MTLLAVAAVIWIALHLGLAGTGLRRLVTARIGDGAFRGVFSILSFAALSFLITQWRHAAVQPLWATPESLRYPLAGVMLLACAAFVGSVTAKNPTAVGGEAAIDSEPRGILRITRHPMLWSFGLWALVHVVANGDLAALIFFGSFAVTSFAGMPSIDAKVASRSPSGWASFAGRTSIVPFAAILAGRNRLVLGEGLPIAIVGGIVLWAALLWLHPSLFGVSALPA